MRNLKYLKKSFLSKNLILVSIIVFLIYSIWDKIISFIKGTPLKRLNTIGATFSDTKALEISESLYISMHRYGTDEEKIFNSLKDISLPNFNKVYNSFGKRYYSQEMGIDGTILLDTKIDLLGWLNAELNDSELEYLKEISPNVF